MLEGVETLGESAEGRMMQRQQRGVENHPGNRAL
jgi:hypothetical protein